MIAELGGVGAADDDEACRLVRAYQRAVGTRPVIAECPRAGGLEHAGLPGAEVLQQVGNPGERTPR